MRLLQSKVNTKTATNLSIGHRFPRAIVCQCVVAGAAAAALVVVVVVLVVVVVVVVVAAAVVVVVVTVGFCAGLPASGKSLRKPLITLNGKFI